MVAVYPGTFDPLTFGHVDIIQRASVLSERLYVAVLNNVEKRCLFSVGEREFHIKTATQHLQNVNVLSFCGLQVELAQQLGASAIIRGIRGVVDLEREILMASGNRMMVSGIETLFIPANPAHSFISSSLVKEIAAFGGNVTGMVPRFLLDDLIMKIRREG